MSCTDIRLQIDRQPRVSDSSSDQELEQIRAQLESLKSESTTEINSGFETPPHY